MEEKIIVIRDDKTMAGIDACLYLASPCPSP